jgi:hypothetical protein
MSWTVGSYPHGRKKNKKTTTQETQTVAPNVSGVCSYIHNNKQQQQQQQYKVPFLNKTIDMRSRIGG